MDTFSTSVSSSTFKLPSTFVSTPRELYNFKTPNTTSHHLSPHLSKPSSSISNKASYNTSSLKALYNTPQASSSLKLSSNVHRNPESGYAAALVDVARCNSSLDRVHKDVQRFLKVVHSEEFQEVVKNPFVDKGRVMHEVAKKGRFNRLLVGLLKMLVEKNRVWMVSEVLMEFERIYDELNEIKVVLVSSKREMEESELLGIAQSVQKLSGAMKVKVRNMIGDEKLPSIICCINYCKILHFWCS